MKRWIPFFVAAGLMGALSWAQSRVTADQGTPGVEGPWQIVGVVALDGGYVFVSPRQCGITSPHKITSVTNASTTTPSAAQLGRLSTLVCNSPQNSSGSVIKCRADGTAPVFAASASNPGDVLELGDCITYTVSAARDILCISNAAGGVLTNTYECI